MLNKIKNLTKGRFRGMKLTELAKTADNPIWDAEESKLIYAYPVPQDKAILKKNAVSAENFSNKNELRKIGPFFTATSPHSHKGPFRWAIDFLVPDGTTVLAAQDGKMVELKEDSDQWGTSPKFRNMLNFITIQHKNGEYSQYCHLAKFSVANSGLAIGNTVAQGQIIAVVGKTGWTDRDHLHFIIFRGDSDPENPFGFKSLRVRFKPS